MTSLESDYCGCVSGKNVDKFSKSGFTKEPAKKVKASLIKECPVNLECVVRERIGWGSYQVFIGEIVEAHIEESILNEKGNFDLSKAAPILYNVDEYWSRGMMKGVYGCGANKF
jgi:flavin reductase (DIM6/NTAB) family NADH-FMN oxidoreductase RutF